MIFQAFEKEKRRGGPGAGRNQSVPRLAIREANGRLQSADIVGSPVRHWEPFQPSIIWRVPVKRTSGCKLKSLPTEGVSLGPAGSRCFPVGKYKCLQLRNFLRFDIIGNCEMAFAYCYGIALLLFAYSLDNLFLFHLILNCPPPLVVAPRREWQLCPLPFAYICRYCPPGENGNYARWEMQTWPEPFARGG